MKISNVNLQAIIALFSFVAAIGVSRMVVNVYADKWKAPAMMVLYLRVLLGFLLAGAIVLGYYSFAGIDVISGR
ncbi:MAG: flagellar biosynthesis protein FliR [Synergistaceae bacterium]|jgi:uncharacterized integral membrane protein|nr:flagellar biosynthesis protein FliR [Synergistaceae bacterium]